jgi:hypothetical protein
MAIEGKCRGCGAAILFVRTEKGRFMPINYKLEFVNDINYNTINHRSHFADCPSKNKKRFKQQMR